MGEGWDVALPSEERGLAGVVVGEQHGAVKEGGITGHPLWGSPG